MEELKVDTPYMLIKCVVAESCVVVDQSLKLYDQLVAAMGLEL